MKFFNHIAKTSLPAGRQGFTIYFAVLVASLALTVGVAIFDLISRELTLSQVATASQYAIYAADTGVECGLYWDFKYGTVAPTDSDGSAFGTSSDTNVPVVTSSVNCAGQDVAAFGTPPATFAPPTAGWGVWNTGSQIGTTYATTTFTLYLSTGACAVVNVGKSGGVATPRTIVVADGLNTCTTNAPLKVERTLQATY